MPNTSKSKQNLHEYYSNAETCRNKMFDDSEPSIPQPNDYRLPTYHGKSKPKRNKKQH